jgi:hypothetical protein
LDGVGGVIRVRSEARHSVRARRRSTLDVRAMRLSLEAIGDERNLSEMNVF